MHLPQDLASQTGLSKQSEDEEDEVGLTMDEEDLDLEYILKEVEEAGMEARKRRFSQSRSGAVAHTTWLLDSSEDPGLDEDVWLKMHESDDVIIDPEDSGSDRVECTDAEQCLLSTVAAQTATLRDGAATDVDGGSASQRQQLDRHGTGRPGYRCGICNELGHNRRTCPTLRETDQ